MQKEIEEIVRVLEDIAQPIAVEIAVKVATGQTLQDVLASRVKPLIIYYKPLLIGLKMRFLPKKQKIYILSFFVTMMFLLTNCQNQWSQINNLNRGEGRNIIVLGDSITAGYGLKKEQAYPYLLSQKLNRPILNRGVSGDKTADGLVRLSQDVLSQKPWIVMIALGGNDFLKKVPKIETEQNLREIIAKIQAQKAITVLLGMNLGLFKDEYRDLYKRVAQETGSYLIPQVLKGIIDNPKHRQEDIIHPNAKGQEILANRLASALKPLLDKAKYPIYKY